jgi:hypothetical protein
MTIFRKHEVLLSHNWTTRTFQTPCSRILPDGLGDEGPADFLLPALLVGLILVVFHNEAIFSLFVAILGSC